MMTRIVIILALMAAAPVSAQTLTCATSSQGYRICQGPGGYRSTNGTGAGWCSATTATATVGRPAAGRTARQRRSPPPRGADAMVRIAITQAAFEAD